MSGEMKLTPGAHPTPPPLPSPPFTILASPFFFSNGGRKSTVGWWQSRFSDPLSLFPATCLRSDSLFPRTHCPGYNVTTSRLRAPVHRSPSTPVHCQKFFFFLSLFNFHLLCLFSCFLLLAPSPSFQPWRKSWMYWHVSFHHANAGEERGERSGQGECVLRRKGPSQPRAKPCPPSGEARRCDSVLLKPGQLLVTLAHRCTHPKGEVTHILCSV